MYAAVKATRTAMRVRYFMAGLLSLIGTNVCRELDVPFMGKVR
jgi:hypothetical protein